MKNKNQNKSPEEQIIEIGYKYDVINFLTTVERENFFKCLKIINKYKKFNYQLIKENFKLINFNRFMDKDSPFNGDSLFIFKIGREFNLVVYIIYTKTICHYFDENENIKTMYIDDFKKLMLKFKEKTKANEIEFIDDDVFLKCRLQWNFN